MIAKSSAKTRGVFPRICFSIFLVLGFTGLTSLPAGAADHAKLEPVDAPERGYYVAGDYLSYTYACPTGQVLALDRPELNFTGGSAGGGRFNMELEFGNHPGTYEVVLTCTDPDSNVATTDSYQFEVRESLQLLATVGTVPGECATTSEITVEEGTEVFWCYTLRVLPEVDFEWLDAEDHVNHNVVGDSLGLDDIDEFITPGLVNGALISTVDQGIARSSIAEESVINDVTWFVKAFSADDDQTEIWNQTLQARAVANVVAAPDPAPVTDPDAKPTSKPKSGEKTASVSSPATSEVAAKPVVSQPRTAG